jgi:hypothetical protein
LEQEREKIVFEIPATVTVKNFVEFCRSEENLSIRFWASVLISRISHTVNSLRETVSTVVTISLLTSCTTNPPNSNYWERSNCASVQPSDIQMKGDKKFSHHETSFRLKHNPHPPDKVRRCSEHLADVSCLLMSGHMPDRTDMGLEHLRLCVSTSYPNTLHDSPRRQRRRSRILQFAT